MTQQTFRLLATAERPSLFVRRQPLDGAPAVLYVHGATFPSALSVGFDFGSGDSWLDDWNRRGFDAWAFDFAGFGESGRYAGMSAPADRHGPLGRAPESAEQVLAVLDLIRRETSQQRVSLVSHSWGGAPAGLATIARPDTVETLVLFAPIARRTTGTPMALPAWGEVTNEQQHQRFVEDVPKGHAPVLEGFDRWAPAYLASDPDAMKRTPPAVRIPNGPRADNIEAWTGRATWDPSRLARPVTIVRGAWDSLVQDADARTILEAATAAPSRRDIKLACGTHLMHLETGRHALYEAVGRSLKGEPA